MAERSTPSEIYNRQQIRSRLEQLAARTGGRVVFPHKPDEVVGLFEQIGRELGKSYSLGYVPPIFRETVVSARSKSGFVIGCFTCASLERAMRRDDERNLRQAVSLGVSFELRILDHHRCFRLSTHGTGPCYKILR